jgi:hypothetical protein
VDGYPEGPPREKAKTVNERDKAALAAAVAAGYVLGRTKKGKLALAGAAVVTGRSLGPRQLLVEGVRRLRGVPAVRALGDQVRGEVYQAARNAAGAAVSRRLGGRLPGPATEGGEDEEPAPEGSAAEPAPEGTAEEDRPRAAGRDRPGRGAPKRRPAPGAGARPQQKAKGASRPGPGASDTSGHGGGRKQPARDGRTASARTTSGR